MSIGRVDIQEQVEMMVVSYVLVLTHRSDISHAFLDSSFEIGVVE